MIKGDDFLPREIRGHNSYEEKSSNKSSIVKDVFIVDEIKLDQFLKWCRAASTGGQSKQMIQNYAVKVNGVTETRRSRKLKSGDLVEVENMGSFRVLTR